MTGIEPGQDRKPVLRDGRAARVAPATPLQHELVGIWEDVLRLAGIGTEDDFFALGGDSLQATHVLLEIHRRFGVVLEAQELAAEASTVAGLARAVERKRKGGIRGAAQTGPIDVDFIDFETPRPAARKPFFTVDPVTGLRLPRPNARMGSVVTNSLGFRGPEIPPAKPAGTIRLAFLGSSGTFDRRVSGNAAAWPHRAWLELERLLPGTRCDYVNAGLPGYHTRVIGSLFDARVAPLAPDVVLIWPSGDANADTAYEARRIVGYDGVHFRPGRLARHSYTWARTERAAAAWWRLARAVPMTPRLSLELYRLAEAFKARLEDLIARCRATASLVVLVAADGRLRRGQSRLQLLRGARTAVFHMPHLAIPDMLDAHDVYHAAMQDVAARTGVPFFDLTGAIPPDAEHFVDSFHFADRGAAMMGRLVAERLAAEPRLAVLAQRSQSSTAR